MQASLASGETVATAPDGIAPVAIDVRRVKRRAPIDIEVLYDRSADALYGFAVRATRDRSVAEELVQESFVRLIAACRTGTAPDDPRAWLFAVCANLIRSRGRRIAVVGRWLQRLGSPGSPQRDEVEPVDQTVMRVERDEALHRELAALPADQRLALLLASEGFSGREIATALDRSEGSTRTLMWRARLELRARLERESQR